MPPKLLTNYNPKLTEACLQVLAMLLSAVGEWKNHIILIGGLVPYLIVKRQPSAASDYVGTGDVDLVVDLAVMADPDAYSTFEDALEKLKFKPLAEEGKASWKWEYAIDARTKIQVELLMDDPDLEGSKVKAIPEHGKLAACNIPHSSIVFDLYDKITVAVESPDGGGVTEQEVRHANLVAFTVLKIFAFRSRREGKDTHDLVYCLQHCGEKMDAVADRFVEVLAGKHGDVIQKGLDELAAAFGDTAEIEGFRRDGPTQAALFEIPGDSAEERDRRLILQRDFAVVVNLLLSEIAKRRPKAEATS